MICLINYQNHQFHYSKWSLECFIIKTYIFLTAADCKIKWHNLRSSYARYLRTMKNNGGRKKKWYLAEAMEFLKEHIGQHKKTSNNIQREESEDEDQVVYTEFNEDNSSATSEMLSNNEDLERLNKSQRKRSKRLSVAEHLAGPMAAYIAARIENSTEVDRHETSPMLHFFKGILPDIEQLTPRRQRIFKEETLRLINKLVDEQEYEEFGQL